MLTTICEKIAFSTFCDTRGMLSAIEDHSIPFVIKRLYYIYSVTQGKSRGEHAHKNLQRVLIPIAGSFSITIDNGYTEEQEVLDDPNYGLYIPRMVWTKLDRFTKNAIVLVLASDNYCEQDYIRNYEEFLQQVRIPVI